MARVADDLNTKVIDILLFKVLVIDRLHERHRNGVATLVLRGQTLFFCLSWFVFLVFLYNNGWKTGLANLIRPNDREKIYILLVASFTQRNAMISFYFFF